MMQAVTFANAHRQWARKLGCIALWITAFGDLMIVADTIRDEDHSVADVWRLDAMSILFWLAVWVVFHYGAVLTYLYARYYWIFWLYLRRVDRTNTDLGKAERRTS
jgi:hypothetical protein